MRKPSETVMKLRTDYATLYAALAAIEMMAKNGQWTQAQIQACAAGALAATRKEETP